MLNQCRTILHLATRCRLALSEKLCLVSCRTIKSCTLPPYATIKKSIAHNGHGEPCCPMQPLKASSGRMTKKYFDWALLFASAIFSVYIHPRALEPYYVVNPLDEKIITVLLIVFFVAVPILVYLSRYIKNQRVIGFLAVLGGITYPLYLLHQRIGNAIMNFVILHYDKISWSHLSISFEVVIIIVAYFVYMQDKKLRAWLRAKCFKG